jgi:hypothetical protein
LEDGRTQSEVTLNFLLIRLCIAPDRWLLIRMITLTRDAWSNGRASATQRFNLGRRNYTPEIAAPSGVLPGEEKNQSLMARNGRSTIR